MSSINRKNEYISNILQFKSGWKIQYDLIQISYLFIHEINVSACRF